MPNKNYKQGYAFENSIVAKLNALHLNSLGWTGIAYRTAGSHTPIDITYATINSVFLIQCKHSKKKVVDIASILCDNNTLLMQKLHVPFNAVRVILIKQSLSRHIIQLKWDCNNVYGFQPKWRIDHVFDI